MRGFQYLKYHCRFLLFQDVLEEGQFPFHYFTIPSSKYFSNDILSTSSKKTENISNNQYKHVKSKTLFIDEKTLSAGCDWPVGITSNNLPTNESGGNRYRRWGGDKESVDGWFSHIRFGIVYNEEILYYVQSVISF